MTPINKLPEIGDVIVFFRSDKMIAHRVVGYDKKNDQWFAKGDTLLRFDSPLKKNEIIGIVNAVSRYGKEREVSAEPDIAALSANLARYCNSIKVIPDFLL